jgi:hypothetical protein
MEDANLRLSIKKRRYEAIAFFLSSGDVQKELASLDVY